jgi:hypothetical protein
VLHPLSITLPSSLLFPLRAAYPSFLSPFASLPPPETLTSISAFRKRASDAATANALLKETKRVNGIDFSHYRSVLKNQAIVDELEQAVTKFKPVTTDASKEIKAIEAFEVKAVSNGPFRAVMSGKGDAVWSEKEGGLPKRERHLEGAGSGVTISVG